MRMSASMPSACGLSTVSIPSDSTRASELRLFSAMSTTFGDDGQLGRAGDREDRRRDLERHARGAAQPARLDLELLAGGGDRGDDLGGVPARGPAQPAAARAVEDGEVPVAPRGALQGGVQRHPGGGLPGARHDAGAAGHALDGARVVSAVPCGGEGLAEGIEGGAGCGGHQDGRAGRDREGERGRGAGEESHAPPNDAAAAFLRLTAPGSWRSEPGALGELRRAREARGEAGLQLGPLLDQRAVLVHREAQRVAGRRGARAPSP